MYSYIVERTQIYLTSDEAQALDREASIQGVTRSHLIREAIDARFLTSRESQAQRMLAILEEYGAPWADRDDIRDGATYVEEIRHGIGAGEGTQPPGPLPDGPAG